jgi:hypothetical protein
MPKEWVGEFFMNPQVHKIGLETALLYGRSLEVEHVPYLIDSNNINVRAKVASVRPLAIEHQEKLIKDKSAIVRAALAANPSANPELLMKLLGDKSVTVIETLKQKKYWDQESYSQ